MIQPPDHGGIARTLLPIEFPRRFAVELCADCNLHCSMCHHPAMKRPKGTMPFLLWQKCADEIAAAAPDAQAWFSFCGEPLLQPALLLKCLDCGSMVGLRTMCLNTNGMLLTADLAERLLDASLSQFVIGLDAYSSATYSRIRCGGDRDVVYQNVENLLRMRAARSAGPEVMVQFIAMAENDGEFEPFRQHWLRRGATVKARHMLSWGGRFGTPLCVSDEERIARPWATTMMHVFWDETRSLRSTSVARPRLAIVAELLRPREGAKEPAGPASVAARSGRGSTARRGRHFIPRAHRRNRAVADRGHCAVPTRNNERESRERSH